MHKPSQKLSIYYSFTSLISIIFSIVIKNVDNFRVKLKKNFFWHFQNVVIFRVKFRITYIYGNTPYAVFEMNCFLSSLGMVPQVIQTNRYTEADEPYAKEILQYTDPYVCKAANIAPLQYVYDVLSPYLYLGHEFGNRLRQKGIAIVHSDRASGMLGFEVTGYLLQQLVKSVREAKEYRKELCL